MVTVSTDLSTSNSSEWEFTTLSDGRSPYPIARALHVEEVVIIVIVIIVWAVALVFFLRKWSSLRILQPMEPRYKHSPKNLENVRIVKRTQDSVIYKNYNRKLSLTMVEREKKRLERMNTVPRMSTLPTIHMEDVTTEM